MALKDFALRVSLTVTKPQLTAKDDKATDDAESANHAHGAGQYRKELYPRHLVAPISEVESSARAFIKRKTFGFVLPASEIFTFTQEMDKFHLAFNQAVTVFMQNYANILQAAQQQQGGLFDASLYPDTTTLRSRFSWQLNFSPVSELSDFAKILAPMEQAERMQIEKQLEQSITTQHNAVIGDAVSRLRSTVMAFAEAMARPNRTVVSKKTGGIEVRPPIIREAVIDNIEELINMMGGYTDALPVEAGPIIAKAAALAQHKIIDLRDDEAMRGNAKDAAKELVAEIDQMMGYAPAPVPVAPVAAAPVTPIVAPVVDMSFLDDEETITQTITAAPAPAPAPAPQGDLLSAIADLEDF